MSQRLAAPSLPPLSVVGHRKDGRPIYNVAGGSVDTVEVPAPADPLSTEEPGTPDESVEGTGSPESEDAGKALERMRAADRAKSMAEKRAAELEAKLREYEDKDKSELERAQRDAEEFKAKAEAAEQNLKRERVNNAFLMNNKFAWHNAERALSLLDLSEVVISEDGKVTGLDKAIEALAKSDPYLLVPEDGNTKGADLPPSGQPVGGGAKSGKPTTDREKLLSKYPALRR